jgi:hypothetical protein
MTALPSQILQLSIFNILYYFLMQNQKQFCEISIDMGFM